MKRIFLSALITAGIVAATFQVLLGSERARPPEIHSLLLGTVETVKTDSPAPAPTPAETYPLVCRGAPSLKQERDTGSYVGFRFTRGTKPAGEGLAPGECSWMDRGMRADEPDKLYQDFEGVEFPPGKQPWFVEFHSPDKYWTFQVSTQLSKDWGLHLAATSSEPLDFSAIEKARGFTVIDRATVVSDLEVSYPLVCRGGKSLVMNFAASGRFISLKFTKGTKPAGDGLAPGECSWKDRGMNSGEPHGLYQYVEDIDSLKAGTLAPENRWYEELQSPDKYWTFMVYNSGRGLTVTSARPKK